MKSFFIAGSHPTISAAEIMATLAPLQPTPICFGGGALILEHAVDLDIKKTALALGGTLKAGVIETELSNAGEKQIVEAVAVTILKHADGGKIKFGLSVYGCGAEQKQKSLGNITKIAITIKRALEERGRSARWVSSRLTTLSSVIVKKNRLIDGGVEIALITSGDKMFVGRTLAVQEFEEYGFRDFGRPSRNIRSGMLPPKLAKILINLARAPKDAALLDPFCGSGTIITEAMLLGYKNLIGSDLENFAVEETKNNIAWIQNHYPETAAIQPKIFQSAAEKISEKIPAQSIDAVVTEPYLGPPLRGSESEKQIRAIAAELVKIYLAAFGEWKKNLKPNARVVIIFPAFKLTGKTLFLEILPQIKKLGYTPATLLSKELFKNATEPSSRGALLYGRPAQRVLREIFVFKNS